MLVAQRESGVMTTTAQNPPLPSDSNPIPRSAPVSATDGPWVRPGAGWIIARYVLLAGTMAAATLAPLLVTTPLGLKPLEALVILLGWIAVWAILSRFHPQQQFWHDALAGTRLISSQATARG